MLQHTKENRMRVITITLGLAGALAVAMSGALVAKNPAPTAAKGPRFLHIGPLTVGPNDTLFAADSQDVSVYALQLGTFAQGGAAGTKDVSALDQQIAALLGTDAASITITDMAVLPTSHNTVVSVMRGQGASAKPALLRVDGAGKIVNVPLAELTYSKVKLPNPPGTTTAFKLGQREFVVPNYPDRPKTDDRIMNLFGTQTITDMAFSDGVLYVSGLSNEEFASKLRVIPYPFKTVDNGTSVEIWHASHGQFETRSPIYSFVPYTINGVPHLIASYLCTPLVKFPIAALKPGADVRGVTIGEFGNQNRPLDMVVYNKDGKEFILMSNNTRGVMKVPTGEFGSTEPILKRAQNTDRVGVVPEGLPAFKGIEQLDLLDATHGIVLARNAENGSVNLQAIDLP